MALADASGTPWLGLDTLALADEFERLRAAYKAHWLVKDCTAFKEFCFANSDQISAALRSQGANEEDYQKLCELYGKEVQRSLDLQNEIVLLRASQAPSEASSGVEPVAWRCEWRMHGFDGDNWRSILLFDKPENDQFSEYRNAVPLYASPPPSASQASCTPPGNEAAQKQLEAVRSLVLRASIGSCSCNTKSPEIIWHDPTCRYVTLMTTLDAIDVLADRVSLVSREEQHG